MGAYSLAKKHGQSAINTLQHQFLWFFKRIEIMRTPIYWLQNQSTHAASDRTHLKNSTMLSDSY